MLKKVFLASSIATAVISSSLAADLPIRQSPAPGFYSPVPISNWTGFYLGVNAGGAIRANNGGSPSFVALGGGAPVGAVVSNNNTARFIGGAQIGANWQIGQFVLGVEADGQGLTRDHNNFPGAFGNTGGASFLGTARARAGVAFGSFLLYGTGGVAFGSAFWPNGIFGRNPAGASTVFNASGTTNMRVGFAAGGGIEYAFFNNWSVKVEYLYTDLGNNTRTFIDPVTGSGFAFSRAEREHIVRAGLNYRFNWFSLPGAVVARY